MPVTKNDIEKLNRELEYEALTELFNWDIDHWINEMSGMTPKQFSRFIALKLGYSSSSNPDLQRKALSDLIKFLDQFGIERIKKQ